MFVHGKDTYISVDGVDLSAFTNSTAFNRGADTHDTTGYGKKAHTHNGGLLNGSVTISGTYDNGAAGPAATLDPLLSETVEFILRPEGTGVGKPERTCSVVVAAYNESSPVADMVTWTAELTISDEVTTEDQT